MKIKSYWRREVAEWSEEHGYINRQFRPIKEKEIQILIEEPDNDKPVLRFLGGPTGHESYYIEDLLRNRLLQESEDFMICAGTVNSWPQCWVKWADVKPLLEKYKND